MARWWCVLWLSLVLWGNAAPPSSTVTVKDQVGLGWQDELVHWPLRFQAGEWTGSAVARVMAGELPVPCQVAAVTRHDDGTIASCEVWVQISLPPGGASTLSIVPGQAGPAPSHPVTVTQSAAGLELSSGGPGAVGLRLPAAGQSYDWPVPAAQVPGPLQALRLPTGQWIGSGAFAAPLRVQSWQVEVLDRGPLFARARVSYQFTEGYWQYTAQVTAGSPLLRIEEVLNTGFSPQEARLFDRFYTFTFNDPNFAPTQVYYGARNDGQNWRDLLVNGCHEEWLKLGQLQRNWFASPVYGFALDQAAPGEFYYLSAYPTHTERIGCLARLLVPGGAAVGLVGLNPELWRNPASLRLRRTAEGAAQLCLPLQAYTQTWRIDGFGRHSPNYTGITLGVPPHELRRVYGIMLSPAEDENQALLASLFRQAARHTRPLDLVKDWTLEWPDPLATATWAATTSPAGAAALELMRGRVQLKQRLGGLARYSMGYHYGFTKNQYKPVATVLDDPTQLTAADRAELRRLAAWLAYDMNAVDTFPYGTGFHLNNPNMTIMATEARFKASMLVKDHPQMKAWGERTVALMRAFFERYTRPSGATYENPHYTLGVTFDWAAETSELLRANGFGDALDSPLVSRSVRFTMDWLSPPDLRFNGHRVVLPLGNGSYQSVPPSVAQRLVSYYRERDPKLASEFQWMANQTLPDKDKVALVADRVPALGSVAYADYGVSLRHGFGTPHETLFHIMAGNCHGHYELEQDQLAYTLYAKGQPISLHFGNGYFPIFNRPWLRNRVSLDHRRQISERRDPRLQRVSFTPEAEYLHAQLDYDRLDDAISEYPPPHGSKERDATFSATGEDIPLSTWSRQVVFVKDPEPRGPNYFVLRDSFTGTATKPSDLSFWVLASEMQRQGQTYHFVGQLPVDLDIFVAEPAASEPETGKYGHKQEPYRRLTGFDPKYHPNGKLWEEQLLLRLRQTPGQGYLTVLYPRLKDNDPPATFTRLSASAVQVATPLSTDTIFMQAFQDQWTFEGGSYQGQAGVVRRYPDGRVTLTHCEGTGKFIFGDQTFEGRKPFVVTFKNGQASQATFEPQLPEQGAAAAAP